MPNNFCIFARGTATAADDNRTLTKFWVELALSMAGLVSNQVALFAVLENGDVREPSAATLAAARVDAEVVAQWEQCEHALLLGRVPWLVLSGLDGTVGDLLLGGFVMQSGRRQTISRAQSVGRLGTGCSVSQSEALSILAALLTAHAYVASGAVVPAYALRALDRLGGVITARHTAAMELVKARTAATKAKAKSLVATTSQFGAVLAVGALLGGDQSTLIWALGHEEAGYWPFRLTVHGDATNDRAIQIVVSEETGKMQVWDVTDSANARACPFGLRPPMAGREGRYTELSVRGLATKKVFLPLALAACEAELVDGAGERSHMQRTDCLTVGLQMQRGCSRS